MNKKVIALVLSCVMLVSASPVVAAEDAPVKPTVDEILSEYHQKAFEAQTAEATDKTTTYSNRSGSKTLEQETVDTLNTAGYEAYNVTASNYDSLEAQLKTDFSSMGLDPAGSYIVVISGEDSDNSNNTRAFGDNLITPTPGDGGEGGDSNYFMYTYNGETYNMRYVTITAADDPAYAKADDYDCLHSKSLELIENCLNTSISALADCVAASVLCPVPLGTVASICGLNLFNFGSSSSSTLTLNGGANWTRTYTQIFDFLESSWVPASCVEYVYMYSYMSGMYYDASLNRMKQVPQNEQDATLYSEHYNDLEWRKENAAKSYYIEIEYDLVGDVKFKYGEKTVITLLENF